MKANRIASIFVLFSLLTILDFSFFSVSHFSFGESTNSWSTFGAGNVLTIRDTGDKHTYHIDWLVLFLNVLCLSVMAGFIDHIISRTARPKSALFLYLKCILGSACLAALVAAIISKQYWGFYFFRPHLMPEIERFSTVQDIVGLNSGVGGHSFNSEDFSIDEYITRNEEDPYYGREGLFLKALKDKGILSSTNNYPKNSDISFLYRTITSAKFFHVPDDGYKENFNLFGYAVFGKDYEDKQLIYLNVDGGQVSNDHHPHYEVLYEFEPTQLKLINHQVFYYDVAGIEGLEWLPMTYGFSLLFTVISIIIAVLFLAFRKKTRPHT